MLKKKVWDKNNYEQSEDFLKFKETELQIIKEKTLRDKKEKIPSENTIDFLRKRILAVPYEQIKQIVEETTFEEAVEYHKKVY